MVMMNCRECEPTHECIACVCERLKKRIAELETAVIALLRGFANTPAECLDDELVNTPMTPQALALANRVLKGGE
jgi:hypothetical protein